MKESTRLSRTLLYLCLCLLPLSSFAQRGHLIGKGTFGRVELGGSFLNLTDFNAALMEKGYDPLSQNFFSMGIGLDRFNKRWVVGGSLYNFMIVDNAQEQIGELASLSYHYLTLRTGLVLFHQKDKYLIYPTVGIGAGLTNFKERPLGEVVSTARWTQGTMLDFRLTGSLFHELDEKQKVEWGLSLGYMYTPMGGWSLDNFRPDNSGISLSPQGFYFRLSMGMGYWQK